MKNFRLIFFSLLIISINIIISQKFNYEFIFIIILICVLYKNLYSKNNIKKSYRQLEILVPIINKLNITKTLPRTNALNDYAASPDFLCTIVDIIEKHKPDLIVEAGSGVSTLIASYSLKKYNPEGKIISFDHNNLFGNLTREEIHKHQLDKYSEIIHSDLIDYPNYKFSWYDIRKATFENKIDLVIIDGPPSKLNKFARYPAIPLLLDNMSDKTIIILDDARRKYEQKIIEKWQKEFNCFNYRYEDNDKGICIINKK